MAKKIETIEHVTFGANGRRWDFVATKGGKETFRYGTPTMPGGRETAVKIARVINGAVKRSKDGTLDGLGRSNVNTIFHSALMAARQVMTPIGTFSR